MFLIKQKAQCDNVRSWTVPFTAEMIISIYVDFDMFSCFGVIIVPTSATAS